MDNEVVSVRAKKVFLFISDYICTYFRSSLNQHCRVQYNSALKFSDFNATQFLTCN